MSVPSMSDKYRGTKEYQLVYAELIMAARYRGVTTYQAVAQILGLPLTGSYMGAEAAGVVGAISGDEVAQGRPMLSALVVKAGSHKPGGGFFKLARQLGRLQSDRPEDEQRFWEQEKEALYETWKETYGRKK